MDRYGRVGSSLVPRPPLTLEGGSGNETSGYRNRWRKEFRDIRSGDGWRWMEMDGWLGGYIDRLRKEFRKISRCIYKQLSLPHPFLS